METSEADGAESSMESPDTWKDGFPDVHHSAVIRLEEHRF